MPLFLLGFHLLLLVELLLLFGLLLHLEVHVVLLRDLGGDGLPLDQVDLVFFLLLVEVSIDPSDVVAVFHQHVVVPLAEVPAVVGPLVEVVDGDVVDVGAFYACDCHDFFEDVHAADYYLGGFVGLLFDFGELAVGLEEPDEKEVLLDFLGDCVFVQELYHVFVGVFA